MIEGQKHQQSLTSEGINPYVINAFPFLRSLARTRSARKQRRLLKRATTEELLALVECALNIVKSRFRITARQRKRMLPHAELIRRLSRLRSERGARRLFMQKGAGFGAQALPALLTPIIIELARKLLAS